MALSPRTFGSALLAGASLLLLAQAQSGAFDAADASTRSSTADVVGTGAAFNGIATVQVSGSSIAGYTNELGVRIGNNGTTTTTFAWTTTADPDAIFTSVNPCAANTAVGGTCDLQFTGPLKAPGTYTFTGRVDGTASGMFRSTIPNIVVTVKYCALPPC